jgi:Ni,Fe-hydrogenase I large subunit
MDWTHLLKTLQSSQTHAQTFRYDNVLHIYHYWLIDWCLTKECFTIENKTTENQWKIAETIYTPLQMVYFGTVLTLSSNFGQFPSRRK